MSFNVRSLPVILFLVANVFPVLGMTWSRYQPVEIPVQKLDTLVIDNVYDLHGQTFEVPDNVVIEFRGGSIRNGTIKGNNTRFENLSSDCLLCSFAGSFQDINTNASVFGLHPKGDGTIKKTPNQQEAFYRLNTLLYCVERLRITFSPGYYGFGAGGDTPQGKGQSCRLWYGHYAFYLYDYTKESRLQDFEIAGNGAKFINVFPYYAGAWTKDSSGRMRAYKEWDSDDGELEKGRHSTEAGGFVYVRTEDVLNLHYHDFTIDMNRDIFQYGGYQGWTQNQCGMALTTNGEITIDRIISRNNVTDGVMILCQKLNGQEIYPKNIVITNSTFQNNVRLGLSLSVGQNNLVDNCDFISNGRICVVNDQYTFEPPYSDIDIEPIIDRPFASVEIRNCRFKETNRHAIVSSRQNINSIIVSNCTALNTLPRWEYGESKNAKGKVSLSIVESITEPLFINAQAVNTLSLDNIDLTDVSLGSGFILYEPREDDHGVEGQLFVTKPISKRASVKNLKIHSGWTFSQDLLARRQNVKDRIANLLSLSSSLHNYQYHSGQWTLVTPSPNGYGYGGWDFDDVTYDVRDGYGIQGAASWDKGITSVNKLTVIVNERRSLMPIFNFMFSDGKNGGISENSGVRVNQLIIIDNQKAFDSSISEPILYKRNFTSIKR